MLRARSRLSIAVPAPRSRREPVVPMINVVFLLLVFFLLTVQFSDPEAGGTQALVSPDRPEQRAVARLFLSPGGAVTFGAVTGPEAIAAAVAAGPVELQVDGSTAAQRLAQVLQALAVAGAGRVDVTTPAEVKSP
jgi:biopolymer transport protein ExbD